MVRLNLGSGDDPRQPGWVHVDLRPEVADVVCDASDLSFVADGEADEVRAFDLIEHFPQARIQDVLAEWWRVLKPGAKLSVRVPNMTRLCEWIANGIHVELAIRNV